MIKIVSGVYGDYTTGKVVAKNKDSAPFELPEEEEKRLVDAGVAIYVDGGRTALPDGVIGIPEYSSDMKVDELRAIGKMMGLTFPVGTTKAEMVAQMDEAIEAGMQDDEATEEADEQTDGNDDSGDDEQPPVFDASEAVQ